MNIVQVSTFCLPEVKARSLAKGNYVLGEQNVPTGFPPQFLFSHQIHFCFLQFAFHAVHCNFSPNSFWKKTLCWKGDDGMGVPRPLQAFGGGAAAAGESHVTAATLLSYVTICAILTLQHWQYFPS